MRTPAAPAVPYVAPETSSKPKTNLVALVVGAILGFLAVRMLPGTLGIRIAGGMFAGLLVGAIPFWIAKSRGDMKLAQNALTWCVIAGAVLGILLAAPVALGFSIAAARRTPTAG
jgi:hypothetical protein